MGEKTVIAVYHKCEGEEENAVIRTFVRLKQLYLSNYTEDGVYMAIFDLSDALCYSVSGDDETVKLIKRNYEMFFGRMKEHFFCGVRNRKYVFENKNKKHSGKYESHYYCGENGRSGIISLLKSAKNGIRTENEFIWASGELNIKDASYLYFCPSKTLPRAGDILKMQKEMTVCSAGSVFPGFGGKKFGDDGLYNLVYAKTKKSKILKEIKGETELLRDETEIKTFISEKASGSERVFFRKATDAVCDRIFGYLKEGFPEIRSFRAASEMLIMLLGMHICGKIGKNEYFEMTEDLLLLCGRFISDGQETSAEYADSAVMLVISAIGMEYYCTETPSLMLLRNDALKMVRTLYPRCEKGRISSMLCFKYEKCIPDKIKAVPTTLKLMMFTESTEELTARLSSVLSGKKDIYKLSEALVAVIGKRYGLPFEKLMQSDSLIYSRLRFAKNTIMSLPDAEVKEKLKNVPVIRTVNERFGASGCDRELLMCSAYLENTISSSYLYGVAKKGDGKLIVCFAQDEFSPLLYDIVRSSVNIESITLVLILKSNKKIPAEVTGKKNVEICFSFEKDKCENRIARAAYFRQLTPETTLSKLFSEAEKKEQQHVFRFPIMTEKGKYAGCGGDAKNGFCTFDENGEIITVFEKVLDVDGKDADPDGVYTRQTVSPDACHKLIHAPCGTSLKILLPDGRIFFDGEKRLSRDGTVFALKKSEGKATLFIIGKIKNGEKIREVSDKIPVRGYFEYCEKAQKSRNKEISDTKKAFDIAGMPLLYHDCDFLSSVLRLVSDGKIGERELLELTVGYMDITGKSDVLDKTVEKEGYPYSFFIMCLGALGKLERSSDKNNLKTAEKFREKCGIYGKNIVKQATYL